MSKALEKAASDDTWTWTPEREKCLDRVLAGWPKKQIAEDLGVHRNTISNWCAHPEFQARVREQQGEHQLATRQRRLRETNMFTDRLARLASKQLDAVEKFPMDDRAIRRARDFLTEYREFREQERIDSGENIQRHQHAVIGEVNHNVQVTSQSFKSFLEDAITSGVIDVEAIDTSDAHALMTSLTQQALLETDLLDRLTEEEARAKFAPVLTQAEKK